MIFKARFIRFQFEFDFVTPDHAEKWQMKILDEKYQIIENFKIVLLLKLIIKSVDNFKNLKIVPTIWIKKW